MGVIRKRGRAWYIDYRIGGKRFIKAIGRSKAIAELALKDIEVRIAKGRAGFEMQRVPIPRFLNEYIKHISLSISPRSAKRYKEIIGHFSKLIKEEGISYLSDVTPVIIEKYMQGRINKVMPQTVNYEVLILGIMLNYAMKMKYIKDNPVKEVSKIRVMNRKLPLFLTKEEIRKLLEKSSFSLKTIIIFLLNTGLRTGELSHLTWDDVNLEKKTLRITGKKDWTPKAKQEREIPLNEQALNVLRNRVKSGEYIFFGKA